MAKKTFRTGHPLRHMVVDDRKKELAHIGKDRVKEAKLIGGDLKDEGKEIVRDRKKFISRQHHDEK